MNRRKRKIFNNKAMVVLLAVTMFASSFSFAFAEEDVLPVSADDPQNEVTADEGYNEYQLPDWDTNVVSVDSVEELAAESPKADNTPFFEMDVTSESADELATEEVTEEIDDILSQKGSNSDKRDSVIDALNESGYYDASETSGSRVEITSKYAYQRLRLSAPEQSNITAYGAVNAVFFDGYYLLTYDSEEATKNAYEALIEDYGTDAVMIDVPIRMGGEKIHGWGTEYMNMDAELLAAAGGREITVAVIDTGIKSSHTIFSGKTIVDGYDFANGDSDPDDDEGHGTAVAGIIAESMPSNVRIMPIKVLDENGEGGLAEVMMALKYADDNDADIANLSLGGFVDGQSFRYLESQFKYFNTLIVCAAGNESENMDAAGVYEFPGELSSTVCVSAIDAYDKKCSFSNYGSAVDFTAPGSSIIVANKQGGYDMCSGTSFSSPYIAAAAALVWAEDESLNRSQVTEKLKSISRDIGSDGKDVYFGNGCPVFNGNQTEAGTISIDANDVCIYNIKSSVTYTGRAITQNPVVVVKGKILNIGRDIEVSYKNNVNVGTAEIIIKGIGNYTGTLSGINFAIVPKSITPSVTLSATSFAYNGSVKTPAVTVKDGGTALRKDVDYTVSYSGGRKNVGTYNVTVTLKGNYRGSKTVSFRIVRTPSPISVSTKTATVKYSRKARTLGIGTLASIKNAKGKLTYSKLSGSKNLSINKNTGKVTVKKKTKKGTYKIKIKIKDPGNAYYAPVNKTITLKVRVK